MGHSDNTVLDMPSDLFVPNAGHGASRRPDSALRWLETDATRTIGLLLVVAALWLATRPYPGIVNDARYYMVQALHSLKPHNFSADLYFRYGSQGQFTFFTKLYAPLVAAVGVGKAAIIAAIIGQTLWVLGLIFFASSVIRDRTTALLSVCAVIVLPSAYSRFLHYGEASVTPRLFAEALTLLALGLIVRNRTGAGWAALIGSAALHPLITLPGMAFALIYLALRQPWWWLVGAFGCMTAIALSVAGIPPFAALRETFDPKWLAIARVHDGLCFITAWTPAAYARVLGTTALAALAISLSDERERRILLVAFAVGLGGLIVTYLGADLAHNVLLTQLQLFRAMWLLTLIAALYVVPVCYRLVHQRGDGALIGMMFLSALAACLASPRVGSVYVASAMMTLTAAVGIWHRRNPGELPLVIRIACLLAIAITGACTSLYIFYGYQTLAAVLLPKAFWNSVLRFALVVGLIGVLALQFSSTGGGTRQERLRRWSAWISILFLPLLALHWDQRTAWQKFAESGTAMPPSLAQYLPKKATVYWEGGTSFLWFRAERPNYISCAQGTGAVFFRATAIHYSRREASFERLDPIDFDTSDPHSPCWVGSRTVDGERTKADLAHACEREPALDYLVLDRPVRGVNSRVWHSPVPFRRMEMINGELKFFKTDRFFIYSCSAFRA